MESESTYSTQPDGPQNIPQRASIGRSASMAQTVRKSRKYTEQEWESHRELVRNLYITEGRTLQDVWSILRERGFEATMKQLKARMRRWQFRKNVNRSDMSFVIGKAKQRAAEQGKKTIFYCRGLKVSREMIERYARKEVPQELDPVFSRADTPSGILYCTPRAFEEQSITSPTPFGATPDLQDESRGLPPRYEEMAQIATVSAHVDGDDVDRVLKPSTSNVCPSPSSGEDPSLGDDLQERDGILVKSEVPFTDSGYKSAPNLDHSPNFQPVLVKSPGPFNTDASAAEGSRGDDYAKTIYSIGSTVDPGYARKYIIELCNHIYSKLRQSVDATNWSALTTVLPELIKAFAIKLCHDSPSQTSQMSREIMYFIHKRHKQVAAQLEAMFNLDDENEPDRNRGHLEDMSVLDKMNMWSSKAEQDHSVPPDTELFEGVQDDDEDLIDQSKLSAYLKIILDSTAYEWFLWNVATEAIIKLETSQPRIRQHILDKLPTGTVSKRRAPNVYEVIFDLEWHHTMEKRLQYEVSEELKRPFQPFESSIIITGSPRQAQGLSIKQYLAQTWPMTGLKLLDALGKATTNPTKHCYVNLPGNAQLEIRILPSHLAVTATGPAYSVADCGELLAWIGSALLNDTQNISRYCLPLITSFRIDAPPSSSTLLKYKGCCSFNFELTRLGTWNESLPGIQNFSRDLLEENTIILGFPIRRRPEGYLGLEVSFGTLLLYLQASKAEIFVLDVFIKGPKRVLKLIKHTDDIFLWQLDHSLADYSSCCQAKCSEAIAIKDYSALGYHALEAGRHILNKYADDSAPIEDPYKRSGELLVDTKTRQLRFLAKTNPADGLNFSSHYQTAARSYPKSQDDGTASRSPSIGSVYSVLENLPLSPHAENPEYSELLSDDPNMFSTDSQFSPRTESREYSLDSDMFSISDSLDDIELLGCEEKVHPILNNISHQLLAGFRTATECQLSPGAGGAASRPVASTTESAHTGTTSGPNRKRNLQQDEEDDTGEEESRRRRPKKMKSDQDDVLEKSFACPFLKWDPTAYSRCCVKKLNSISYVKQHLHRKHTPERYCQTCHSTDFPDDDSLQSHINIGKCTCRSRTMLDGISYQQRFKLSRKSKPKSSKENQWYAIWDILFPGDRRPCSIYVDTDLALEMRQFREYCERHGPAIMREQMESDPTWLSSGNNTEQRRAFDRLIAYGLNALFDNWGSRNSSASTSPERQKNDNPEQSRYETPTNSLVDSGVAMGGQSSFTETRYESSELPLPSIIPAVGSAACSGAAETRARGSSPVQEAPIAPDPTNIQSLPSASLDFTAGGQDWETEYQGSGLEASPHATFEHDFNFGAFLSLEDMLGHIP
ncbi:hypothetical protein BKA61DRAFT_252267, partial [Leptodontidium sp. MPI-SDFR-AT-0119]